MSKASEKRVGRDMGVIVTARHDDGPPLWSFRVPGAPRAALKEACSRLTEGWRIVSISTPQTIYRDLQGTRAVENRKTMQTHSKVKTSGKGRRQFHDDPRTAEIALLASIGKLDLLAPLAR